MRPAPMTPIYPDLAWYASIGERKAVTARCPFASVSRCPRYFESVALLSDARITAKLPAGVEEAMRAKWQTHEAWPVTAEGAAAIFGCGGGSPQGFSNFCPEVSFDTFKLFATTLIRYSDSLDREHAERALAAEGAAGGPDWRRNWQHVEPLHYTECPVFSKLRGDKPMTQVTFNAPVTGQVNIAGTTVSSPVLRLSMHDILTQIEASNGTPAEKEAAKSKLVEFLSHPLVAAIAGGIAGSAVGLVK